MIPWAADAVRRFFVPDGNSVRVRALVISSVFDRSPENLGVGVNEMLDKNASDMTLSLKMKRQIRVDTNTKEFNDIYNDQLVDIFEKTTGLYTKL